jgi:hypothetical protein
MDWLTVCGYRCVCQDNSGILPTLSRKSYKFSSTETHKLLFLGTKDQWGHFNYMNSRLYLHWFTNSTSWVNVFNIRKPQKVRFKLKEFTTSWIHDLNWVHDYNFQISNVRF